MCCVNRFALYLWVRGLNVLRPRPLSPHSFASVAPFPMFQTLDSTVSEFRWKLSWVARRPLFSCLWREMKRNVVAR